ncbi:hypothetical protein C172_30438 [Paenibacillus sp. FSL H8-457]|nr:hypothetical protein C172_30438 [Paenibacillus sp. FSL H8-457]
MKLKRCDRVRKLSRLPNVISDLALRTGMDIEVSFEQASIRSRPGEIRVVTREQVLVPWGTGPFFMFTEHLRKR